MSAVPRVLGLFRKLIVVAVLLGLIGGAGWGVWHWQANGAVSARYRVEKVTRGRVAALINASGTVVPEDVIDVGAQVAGKIDRFNKDPDVTGKTIDYGSRVEKGLILAWIDDALYRPEVGIAKADL